MTPGGHTNTPQFGVWSWGSWYMLGGSQTLGGEGHFGPTSPPEGNSVARFWPPNPPNHLQFQVGMVGMGQWDPGDMPDTTVPYWGPCHLLDGSQTVAGEGHFLAQIPMSEGYSEASFWPTYPLTQLQT